MSVMRMPNPTQHNLRQASVADAADMASIRAACFDTTWTAQEFQSILNHQHTLSWLIPGIAYALVQMIAPEAELLTIATRPSHRRMGIAQMLLQKTIEDLQTRGIHTLHLEVNEHLADARALYQKTGFVATGRRKDYYLMKNGKRADAILMKHQTPL